MKDKTKFSLSLKALMTLVFFAMLGVTFINSPRAFALNISDIINSPKVLGESTTSLYPYPTASLVNDGGTIYFISGTTKVPFTNYSAFTGLGYSLKNVVSGSLVNYSLSSSYLITTANARHPWGSWLSYNKVVYYLSQSGMVGVPSADIFLANQGQWNLVVPANKYDIAILKAASSLPVLAYADPRIISQPVLQFSGSNSQTNSASPVSSPVATPVVPVTASIAAIVSPTPQITLPANVYASTTATFSITSGDTSTPLVYTIAWGDGSPTNSVSANSVVHTYYAVGPYTLGVQVTDRLGNSYASTTTVNVILPPTQTPSIPQISLPSGAAVNANLSFSASSGDPQNLPLTYTFSWGDGTADTIAPANIATHSYTYSDSFVVEVTATDTEGFSSSNSVNFYVAP